MNQLKCLISYKWTSMYSYTNILKNLNQWGFKKIYSSMVHIIFCFMVIHFAINRPCSKTIFLHGTNIVEVRKTAIDFVTCACNVNSINYVFSCLVSFCYDIILLLKIDGLCASVWSDEESEFSVQILYFLYFTNLFERQLPGVLRTDRWNIEKRKKLRWEPCSLPLLFLCLCWVFVVSS